MSYVFEGKDGNYCEAFIDSLRELRDKGRISSPRGQKTLELDHVVFKIDPRKSLYTSPKRNLNFFFLIAENLWYWSGRNSTELPSYYVKNYRSFSDDGIHQGAYGPQFLEQIRFVINTLKKDPDSRQAVITLWRPNPSESKDKPCTVSFDFKIRDGKLNMHATMRSNDAIWGNNYDIPSFSMLLLSVSGILGVPSGVLYLTAHSYHVYEQHFDMMDDLIKEEWNYTEYPEELMLPEYKVKSLENHIKNIEEVLAAHYIISHTSSWRGTAEISDFYGQFVQMMNLHKAIKIKDEKIRNQVIGFLKAMHSPFGIIYYERYITQS